MLGVRGALLLPALLHITLGLKEGDFRKCADTPFCRVHRAPPTHTAAWVVNSTSVSFVFKSGSLHAQLLPPAELPAELPLVLSISVLRSGAVRVRFVEDPTIPSSALERPDPDVSKPEVWDDEMDGPWDAPSIRLGRAVKTRFEPTQAFASGSLAPMERCEHLSPAAGDDRLRCPAKAGETVGAPDAIEVRLRHSPLSIELLDRDGAPVVVLNGRGRLLHESFRQLVPSEVAESKAAEPHTFNGFTDPMVYGPSSVGLDVDFPGSTHAYGLPERTVARAWTGFSPAALIPESWTHH